MTAQKPFTLDEYEADIGLNERPAKRARPKVAGALERDDPATDLHMSFTPQQRREFRAAFDTTYTRIRGVDDERMKRDGRHLPVREACAKAFLDGMRHAVTIDGEAIMSTIIESRVTAEAIKLRQAAAEETQRRVVDAYNRGVDDGKVEGRPDLGRMISQEVDRRIEMIVSDPAMLARVQAAVREKQLAQGYGMSPQVLQEHAMQQMQDAAASRRHDAVALGGGHSHTLGNAAFDPKRWPFPVEGNEQAKGFAKALAEKYPAEGVEVRVVDPSEIRDAYALAQQRAAQHMQAANAAPKYDGPQWLAETPCDPRIGFGHGGEPND